MWTISTRKLTFKGWPYTCFLYLIWTTGVFFWGSQFKRWAISTLKGGVGHRLQTAHVAPWQIWTLKPLYGHIFSIEKQAPKKTKQTSIHTLQVSHVFFHKTFRQSSIYKDWRTTLCCGWLVWLWLNPTWSSQPTWMNCWWTPLCYHHVGVACSKNIYMTCR